MKHNTVKLDSHDSVTSTESDFGTAEMRLGGPVSTCACKKLTDKVPFDHAKFL